MLRSVVLPAPVPPDTSDVEPRAHRRLEEVQHRLRHRVPLDEVLRAEAVGPEPANRQRRPVEGERRDDRVDTGAVGQARVHHRARFVDAPADGAHDALDDLQQVLVVLEDRVALFEPAFALDVDPVVTVDEDVGDGRVAQEGLERPEAEQLVEDVGDERLALEEAERRRVGLLFEHAHDQPADLGLRVFAVHSRQALEVEPVEQVLVDLALDLLVLRMAHVHGPRGARRRRRHREIGTSACSLLDQLRRVSRPKTPPPAGALCFGSGSSRSQGPWPDLLSPAASLL